MRLLIFVILLATSANSIEIYCESIINCWSSTYCCILKYQAYIHSEDSTIANRDKSVTEIDFTRNKKIKYLPVSIHDSFPNLRLYAASQCILDKVQKANFELLDDLVEINLGENRITAINSDTFEGLRKLEVVVLSRNYIKNLNGQTFEGLPALHHLDLVANDCINKKLIGRKKIKNSLLIISDKCGFDDSGFGKAFHSLKKSISRILLKPFTA